MYVNKCTKCGKEFETKNPKRVICPECLYSERSVELSAETKSDEQKQSFYSSYNYETQPNNQERYQRGFSSGGYDRAERGYDNRYQNRNNYTRPQQNRYGNQQGGYNQNRNNYARPQQNRYGSQQGGYNQNRSNYGQQNRYGNQQGGYNRFNNNRRPNNFNRQKPRPQRPQKTLLINKEQLEQIELLYKQMLPLPNPDAHEVIGEKIGLEPRKVFFGINLVRQKMMLPKLPYPKRKLAISPDQMYAIQNLYEPLLPLPPIGCHKIIASQLKMDEWRVHVGIGLIRAKMGLDRWNENRADAPKEFKAKSESKADEVLNVNNETSEVKPKKAGRKKKVEEPDDNSALKEKPKRATRKKKVEE